MVGSTQKITKTSYRVENTLKSSNFTFLLRNCGTVVAKPGLEQLSRVGPWPVTCMIMKPTNGQAELRASFNFLTLPLRPYTTDYCYFNPR